MHFGKINHSFRVIFVLAMCLFLLASCSNKNSVYGRFNVVKGTSQMPTSLKFNRVIYCGLINLMATEEIGYRLLVTDTMYKDSTIKILAKILVKDSLFRLEPYTVYDAHVCEIKDNIFFKSVLDSVILNYKVTEPHMLPIINYTGIEGITGPPGQISFMKNHLTILFCVFDKDGLKYINGQKAFWGRNEFKANPYIFQKTFEKAVKRGFKEYKNYKGKPIK